MYQELYKYLILNKKILFPGIGSFVIENLPASVDEYAHIIKPAQQTIRFSTNGDNHFNDFLFSFLARESNQTVAESERKFNIFIAQLKSYLRSNDVVLPSMGTLKRYSSDGVVTFVPHQKKNNHFLPLITLPDDLQNVKPKTEQVAKVEKLIETESPVQPVIEKVVESQPVIKVEEPLVVEEKETLQQTKKDKWWVYALLLTALAVGGLLYYYFYYNN